MKTYSKKILSGIVTALISTFSNAGDPTCVGTLFNPIAYDWSQLLPVTVAGVPIPVPGLSSSLDGGANCAMNIVPITMCPADLLPAPGVPVPAATATMWLPSNIVEVERVPMCVRTLAGLDLGSSIFKSLSSEENTQGGVESGTSQRRQIHDYKYPLFSQIKKIFDSKCKSYGGTVSEIMMGYISEVNPMHQSDTLAAVISPEAGLTDNFILNMGAGLVDGIASTFYCPIDPLFFMGGTWGNISLPSGNASIENSNASSNGQVLAKYLYQQHRLLLKLTTIGPLAMCHAMPIPVITKSQYRFQEIHPIYTYGTIRLGKSETLWSILPLNYPTQESTAFFNTIGVQCAIHS